MTIRQDLVNSAVSFLQDPSVAGAPIEKRIAFLQSKNLTQEEVDASLAQAAVAEATATNPSGYQNRPAPPPPASYGQYPGYWPQPAPPPELPKRDWRDWFIMATVLGGVSYGLYFTAKRYVIPLIAPPTPPQLESDKKHVDESFERAFALLDQLSTDTQTLKDAEEQRTVRLDAALTELENTITAIKEADRQREHDARRNGDDIRALRDLIPKALEARQKNQDARLSELSVELKGLKTLIGNRVGAPRPGESAAGAASLRSPTSGVYSGSYSQQNGAGPTTSSAVPTVEEPADSSVAPVSSQANVATTESSRARSPYGRLTNGKAAIPAWQMAASKKAEDDDKAPDTSESGTVTAETS